MNDVSDDEELEEYELPYIFLRNKNAYSTDGKNEVNTTLI